MQPFPCLLMPSISLCMIVKDEEQYLPQCLASVKNLVDEIVIVDTGSTDNTKEIAKAAGAKVFDFAWQNDFSTARNFSLSQATKEWILVMDADETLALQDHPRFRELLIWTIKHHPKTLGFKFHQRNYINDRHTAELVLCDPESGYTEQQGFAGYTLATPVRLFRRGLEYQFAVHEAVEPAILAAKGGIFDSKIPIHHFNERKGAQAAAAKVASYGAMAGAQADATPQDPKPFYELGLSQSAEGKLDEAIVSFKTVLALNSGYRHPYSNLAEIYLRQHKVDESVAMLQKAIATKPIAADHYNLGLLQARQKNYPEAEQSLRAAINLEPKRVEFYATLSSLYARMEQFGKALKIFDICIQQNPARVEPYNALGLLFFKLGKLPDAIKVFEKGKQAAEQHEQQGNIEYLKLLINLAESYVKLGEKDKAKAIFQQLADGRPEQKEIMEKRIAELEIP